MLILYLLGLPGAGTNATSRRRMYRARAAAVNHAQALGKDSL
jgi:hypothetical protein